MKSRAERTLSPAHYNPPPVLQDRMVELEAKAALREVFEEWPLEYAYHGEDDSPPRSRDARPAVLRERIALLDGILASDEWSEYNRILIERDRRMLTRELAKREGRG